MSDGTRRRFSYSANSGYVFPHAAQPPPLVDGEVMLVSGCCVMVGPIGFVAAWDVRVLVQHNGVGDVGEASGAGPQVPPHVIHIPVVQSRETHPPQSGDDAGGHADRLGDPRLPAVFGSPS